jgi:lysine-ketoglutarate reductase/saccharopine dehydrogenase-like protein (TIGR00300 family)
MHAPTTPDTKPDFSRPPFAGAPDARFAPLPADGVLPEGFFSTSNLPTYIRVDGTWNAPIRPRMDCVVVKRGAFLETIEPRRLRRGDLIAMGEAEDGTEGIVVHARGFLGGAHGANEFRFMSTEVSRERPVNYEELAARVAEEKRKKGYLVWVVGPALVHSRARADFEWFIRNGYVQAVLAGNAVAVHDIEAAIFGTTLGMSNTGQPTEGGHGLHMRAINRVRAAGSIERAVETGLIKTGIMHALVTNRIPYVLAGSIRDDGPLPGVYSDNLAAQDAMREHTVKATGAIFVATALHAIAVGNMLPAFYLCDGVPLPLMTICVDQTEFVVNKLRDRGTHQAYGVVTNAQDFMHVFRFYTERREQVPA